ncbi:hypothetical protein KAU11_10500 [Candidatus Babeliales bacterium]|nr:hypothetical protein [Candidatus Babeliales bacterium]
METVNVYNHNFSIYKENKNPGLNFNHRIRDADVFTESAQHFNEFGVYTKHPENRYKGSKYWKFWAEEYRRCIKGYHIGRDWIPGYYYFYLNYSPIERLVLSDEQKERVSRGEKVRGERILAFPAVWDYDYYYFHYLEEAEKAGKHAVVLKSRGQGYSYKGASMAVRNYSLIPESKTYVVAHEKQYLEGADGILTRAFNMREHINENTAFRRYSHKKNTVMHMRASKLVNYRGQPIEKGYKSAIIGISLKDNPDRIRGQRGKLMLYEESGKNPSLLTAWQIAKESFEQGGVVFGLMVAFGTSGSDMKSFRNLKEMFYKPKAYDVYNIPDVWSKRPTGDVSFFVPAYANIPGATDLNGNTDVEKSYRLQEALFDTMKAEHAEPTSIIQKRMERPKHPEEALLRKSVSMFPVQKLRDRLADLTANEVEMSSKYVGRMKLGSNGVPEFMFDNNAIDVTEFPHDRSANNAGAIVIWEKPVIGKNKKVIPNMYIAGTDPYDHDKSTTMSLGSTFVMNKMTGELVAEYTGRPSKSSEYYEQLRLLLIYYGAQTNFENNLLGLKNYLQTKNQLYLLLEAPMVVKRIIKRSSLDREYGTPGLAGVFSVGREWLNEWLQRKVFEDEDIEYVHTLKSIPLIQELIDFNEDGNFDRIVALILTLIHYEEKKGIIVRSGGSVEQSIEDDAFWNKLAYGFD